VTNLITPRSLFSPIFLQSCSVIHESGSDNPFQRYGQLKFSKMAGGRILDLVQLEVSPSKSIRSDIPENPTIESNTKSIKWSVVEIWPFEIFQDGSKMADSRHLGLGETGNSAIRSAVSENPILEPNTKWIGWPVPRYGRLKFSKMWGRSLVSRRSSIYRLFSCTPLRYVRNIVRKE